MPTPVDQAPNPVGPLFLGTHTPHLDEKNRLVLPSRFREALVDGLVLTRGQERCLYGYPVAVFARAHEQLRAAPLSSRQARDVSRVLLSGASDEVPDRQGRITVPPALRRYAGLGRECTVIGAGERIEVWATPAWEDYLAEAEERFATATEEVLPGLA